MSGSEVFDEDEISLFDLWQTLKDKWRYVLGGILLGVLGAAAAIATSQAQYEAIVMLQTGQVAGTIIEDPSTIVERFKSPSFHLDVAKEVNDPNLIAQAENGGGTQNLSATVPKASPSMVEVKVKAKSPEFAKKIADAATAKLIGRQEALSAQTRKKIEFDLSVTKEKLAKSELDLLALSKTLDSVGTKDDRFTQISLMMSIKLQKESEMFALRQSVFALEIALLPPSTQPARVLEAIFVSPQPVSPKKGLLLALGLVGGLLVGVMSVFVSSAWQRAHAQRSARDK